MVGLTANTTTLEVPNAFTTVTPLYPAEVRKLAGMAAVTWVELTNVVAWGAPFHRSVEPSAENPVPFAVSVKPELPALIEPGARLRMVGASPCPRSKRLALTTKARTATKQTYCAKALPWGGVVLPFMVADSFAP
jgi:hypothetical protein